MKFNLVFIFNPVKSFQTFWDFATMCQNQFIPVVKMSGITIDNNYSPKWRRLVLDIYRTAKQWGKYPRLATDTEVNNCFSIY